MIHELANIPQQLSYRVIAGATGSGKSRILEALHTLGAQVLDLEKIANHKGSVLGNMPDSMQPSQRYFESNLLDDLKKLDPKRPVFIESESKKIGNIQVPQILLDQIRQSACIQINASIESRIDFLMRDYAYLIASPEILKEKLAFLKELQGHERLEQWFNWISQKAWHPLVKDLLERHYDKLYEKSFSRNFVQYQNAKVLTVNDLSANSITHLAYQIQCEFDLAL